MLYKFIFQTERHESKSQLNKTKSGWPALCYALCLVAFSMGVTFLFFGGKSFAASPSQNTLPVPSVLILSNTVDPVSDAGRFNLLVNGQIVAADVQSGFSTAPMMSSEGTYEVSVTAGTANSLDQYETTITCVDNSNKILANQAATSVTIEIMDESRIECAVIHRRLPALSATLTDTLVIDADENGVPSPGDTIQIDIDLNHLFGTLLTNVVLSIPVDPNTRLVSNSVTTTLGTINRGYRIDDEVVKVTLGDLAAATSAKVTFQIQVDNPLPSSLNSITFQGVVTSNELADLKTDDPSLPGPAQPTEIGVTVNSLIRLSQKCVRLIDADGDGVISNGDTVFCEVLVANVGNGEANNLTLQGQLDIANADLISGTLMSTAAGSVNVGERNSSTTISVQIEKLTGGGAFETLSYMIRVNANTSVTSIESRFEVVTFDSANQTTRILAETTNVVNVTQSGAPVGGQILYLPLVSQSAVSR